MPCETTIVTLDEDCLLKILSYLGVEERIQKERVCKVWRSLIRMTFRSSVTINVANLMKTTYQTHYQQDHINFAPTTVGILSRCGPYIKEIDFGSTWLKVSQTMVACMEENCLRLTKLDFASSIVDGDLRPLLDMTASQLIELGLNNTIFVRSSSLENFNLVFPKLVRLKKLGLNRFLGSLALLQDVSPDLVSINLCDTRCLDLDILHQFLINHVSLQELRLSNFEQLDQLSIEIIGNLTKLEILELNHLHSTTLELEPLGNIGQLRELYLQNCAPMSTGGFHEICYGIPNIRILNLSVCKRIFNFSPLEACRILTTLTVTQTCQICDEDFTHLAASGSLQSLTLVRCENITTSAIRKLARSSCPFTDISIHHCSKVTDEAIEELVKRQAPIPQISVQNCNLTGEVLKRIACLPTVLLLTELDVSYNRKISDRAIVEMHTALQETIIEAHKSRISKSKGRKLQDIDKQQDKAFQFSTINHERDTGIIKRAKPLILHVYQTAVSRDVDEDLNDCLQLVF